MEEGVVKKKFLLIFLFAWFSVFAVTGADRVENTSGSQDITLQEKIQQIQNNLKRLRKLWDSIQRARFLHIYKVRATEKRWAAAVWKLYKTENKKRRIHREIDEDIEFKFQKWNEEKNPLLFGDWKKAREEWDQTSEAQQAYKDAAKKRIETELECIDELNEIRKRDMEGWGTPFEARLDQHQKDLMEEFKKLKAALEEAEEMLDELPDKFVPGKPRLTLFVEKSQYEVDQGVNKWINYGVKQGKYPMTMLISTLDGSMSRTVRVPPKNPNRQWNDKIGFNFPRAGRQTVYLELTDSSQPTQIALLTIEFEVKARDPGALPKISRLQPMGNKPAPLHVSKPKPQKQQKNPINWKRFYRGSDYLTDLEDFEKGKKKPEEIKINPQGKEVFVFGIWPQNPAPIRSGESITFEVIGIFVDPKKPENERVAAEDLTQRVNWINGPVFTEQSAGTYKISVAWNKSGFLLKDSVDVIVK